MSKRKKDALATYSIYELFDSSKSWYYIGSTKNSLKNRLIDHRSKINTGSVRYMYPGINKDDLQISLIKKIGPCTSGEAHAIEEQVTREYANKYGMDMILNEHYGDTRVGKIDCDLTRKLSIPIDEEDNIYYDENGERHLTDAAKERISKGLTPEIRAKISAAAKQRVGDKNPFYGRNHSEKTRKLLSEKLSGEGNPWYGRKHTEETKQKMSKAAMGHIVSEETRRKMGANHKDMSGENNPMYGKKGKDAPWYGRKHTPEELEKMREGRRRYEERKRLQKHLDAHGGYLVIEFDK